MQTGTGSDTLTCAYGVDFSPSKQWTYGVKFERGTVSDPFQGDISLNAVSGTLQYTRGLIKYGGALEWRRDDSSITGASHTELTRNSLSYQVDPDWKLFGKLNWSKTSGPADPSLDDSFQEAVVGAAWRPVRNDRWTTQSEGDWFASQARLSIFRTDVLLPRQWDAMIELRRLSIRETDDHRTGFLLGGYRHVGDHVKIGAGYNFTNYSDELTDVSYRSRGFFVNVIAKF